MRFALSFHWVLVFPFLLRSGSRIKFGGSFGREDPQGQVLPKAQRLLRSVGPLDF